MTAKMACLFSRLRRIALPLAVGVLLGVGLVLFGTVFAGDRAEGAAVSTTSAPGSQAVLLPAIAAAVAPSGGATSSDHVVVGLESGAVLPDLSGYGLTEARAVGHEGIYVLALAADGTYPVAEILRRVQGVDGVAWAEAETPVSACVTPNDPYYPPSGLFGRGQWALTRMGMPAAWDVVTGSSDVIVAIIDTGINKDLADFAGRIVSPYNAINRRTDWPEWRDNVGHGTAVAGVAVSQGNDAQGIAGVAWNVKIMPVKIADTAGTTDYVLADGIYWAVDHGADVINISFAGSDSTNVEIAAVNYALDHGVTVVAAAGNSYPAGIAYPAGLHGVIAVGATTPTDTRASFSSTGPEIDLVAPGTEILSHTVNGTGWASWSGTSFAAPEVAGIVALMKSLDSSLTPAQITSMLTSTADDLGATGWDSSFGWGMVDADEAVAQVYGGSSTTTSSSTTSSSTTTTTAGTTTTTLPPTTTTTVTEPPTTTTTVPRFPDVSAETTPYSEQIDYLAGLGVVSGSADGFFYPRDPLKRQQFAKMIILALGYLVTENDTCPFGDVSHTAGVLYPYHYVAVAWKQGITLGTKPGYFSPYAALTRAQMITMVARAANLPDPPVDFQTSFPNFSSVHYPYARKAANAGLLDALVGMGPGYDFMAPASRGETCALLYALLR
jgi:subtilisin family serine protease